MMGENCINCCSVFADPEVRCYFGAPDHQVGPFCVDCNRIIHVHTGFRDKGFDHEPITEEWLKSVGFKWHQFDRQPSKHWLLWLGDAMNGGGFSSFEDIGIELAAGAYNYKRDDSTEWFCWLRGDSCHRYHRFIHVRHISTQRDVIQIVEGLTGQTWNPENHHYGSVRTPEQAERIRREEAERIDRRENWKQRPPWAEVEKDDTRGRALPEHMDVAEKTRGAI